MKILGIVASPRRYGNTETLMNLALKSAKKAGADDVELYTIKGKNIAGCIGCDTCKNTGVCAIKDDMAELLEKMTGADGIILGTPVYFWGPTSQAKAIIDRSGPLMHSHRLRNKAAGVIVVATRGGCTLTFNSLLPFINIHRMLYVGGAIAYACDKGEVKSDKQGMSEAIGLGRAMVRQLLLFSGKSVPDVGMTRS
jgi:multimeric flavodoxin WrbA